LKADSTKYAAVQTSADETSHDVYRVLAQMDLTQEKMFRWKGSASAKEAKA
jgi:hypothetical protein